MKKGDFYSQYICQVKFFISHPSGLSKRSNDLQLDTKPGDDSLTCIQ